MIVPICLRVDAQLFLEGTPQGPVCPQAGIVGYFPQWIIGRSQEQAGFFDAPFSHILGEGPSGFLPECILEPGAADAELFQEIGLVDCFPEMGLDE